MREDTTTGLWLGTLQPMSYDSRNLVLIMVHICDTFELSHTDMMNLRQKVEEVYRNQPVRLAKKRRKLPVSVQAIATTIGLSVAYGGGKAAIPDVLLLDPKDIAERARAIDPYA
jgi:hypothetical protein